MTTRIVCVVFSMLLAFKSADAKPHLFAVAPEVFVEPSKAVSVDIYLYNDSEKELSVRPLRFASAQWSSSDPKGDRFMRSGESRTVSDHGAPDDIVQPHAMLYQRIELDIKPENGDIITVRVTLGKDPVFEANPVLLYAAPKN
jgi:hypothetical protein